MSQNDDILLFLHVPKTAGVSVISFLRKQYRKDERVTIRSPDYVASAAAVHRMDDERKARTRLVEGHFSYGLHEAFDRPSSYFSILREPVDRLVSLYCYTRATPEHARHHQVSAMSLSEFALSGIHPEIENCQTKMLSGRSETHFITGTEPCSDIDLERAKRHIESKFISIGIYEQLDASVRLCCNIMGWKFEPVSRKNITTDRRPVADLSDEEVAVITSVNRYDIALYEHARGVFEESQRRHRWWKFW